LFCFGQKMVEEFLQEEKQASKKHMLLVFQAFVHFDNKLQNNLFVQDLELKRLEALSVNDAWAYYHVVKQSNC